MKFSNIFDNLSVEEQKGVALFLCNAFSSVKGSEWVMYASTWPLTEDTETSNVRVAAKVAGQFQCLKLVFNVHLTVFKNKIKRMILRRPVRCCRRKLTRSAWRE